MFLFETTFSVISASSIISIEKEKDEPLLNSELTCIKACEFFLFQTSCFKISLLDVKPSPTPCILNELSLDFSFENN